MKVGHGRYRAAAIPKAAESSHCGQLRMVHFADANREKRTSDEHRHSVIQRSAPEAISVEEWRTLTSPRSPASGSGKRKHGGA